MLINNKTAEAEYEKVITSVLWDIEHCPIPKGCKAEGIATKISSALHKLNYRGEISISAYGNMDGIPPSMKEAFTSTGIHLHHVHSRDISLTIFSHALRWSYDNPAPTNLMFISRHDTRFPDERRKMGHNILLAHPPHPSDSLLASANTTWLWKSLLEEPDITSQTLTPCQF